MDYVPSMIILGACVGFFAGGLQFVLPVAGRPLEAAAPTLTEAEKRGRMNYIISHAAAGSLAGLLATMLMLNPQDSMEPYVPMNILFVIQAVAGLTGPKFIATATKRFDVLSR